MIETKCVCYFMYIISGVQSEMTSTFCAAGELESLLRLSYSHHSTSVNYAFARRRA
jgi:hypothetical protein